MFLLEGTRSNLISVKTSGKRLISKNRSKKINHSYANFKTCFQKILKAREEHIAIVNQKATAQLAQLSQNKAEYQNMLEKLWTQATFKLLENECVVICREGDVELIKV